MAMTTAHRTDDRAATTRRFVEAWFAQLATYAFVAVRYRAPCDPIAECETIYLDRLYILLTQRLGNLTSTLRSRRRF